MTVDQLKKEWQAYEMLPFEGWDFGRLENRWENGSLPWDYKEIVRDILKPDMRLLDMGTGGGEFLISLLHPYEKTAVTEGWLPNFQLLQRTLQPKGVDVKWVAADDQLDFPNDSFDIVLNRHELFDAKEVARVLKPGGVFITQQVGGQSGRLLSEKLIPDFIPPFSGWDLTLASAQLKAAGFEVLLQDECFPCQYFFDMGALIYYVRIISWEFPGFSVATHFQQLLNLYEELLSTGRIVNKEHRFLVAAQV
ncbi:class I SAM-dependent methyltransferase [Vagococcus acidifermentans]|uniref:SAM-dependent methyltransferase n=1 Tax=Vagococcus acidifermentans TaxID=564710 RepID=A0A430AQM5_9ENTE|nr:class I SAM-dependent methyltransferase [Vagococcus acidifermentans]RSU10283.1 SAM-dependent methyltransferase [Vagococcus acidifermentans]